MNDAPGTHDFAAFVGENWSSLMSIGVAISGSRHDAEDLVQAALTATYARWHTIREDEALAYLRRAILNSHISRWRRDRGAEVSVDEPPTRAARDAMAAVDERLNLMPSLRALPPRQRAVIVLRYLCDLSDQDIATTLQTTTSTVRSQAVRALANLRTFHSVPEAAAVS